MNTDTIPVPIIFLASVAFVLCATEVGFRLGHGALKRSKDEKESPVSAIGGAVLGLTAFMLAFAFGIVTDRFDARKALIREEAGAIRTAYSRADFLPEPDRAIAKQLLKTYTVQRVGAVQSNNVTEVRHALAEADRIQRELWGMAVGNARKDMNSDVAALYIEALNEVTNINAQRVAVAWQSRVPAGVWLVLYLLIALGTLGMGYQTAIAGSGRSWATTLLAVAFSIVIALVVSLDRPQGTFIRVSQQPLMDVRTWMGEDTAGH
jgi:hypothetical protein